MDATAIMSLAKQTSNPFYVYSLKAIEERCGLIRSALPSDVQIYYSFKANSHPEIVKAIRGHRLLADVASLGELEVATAAGFAGSDIEFTGPGKSRGELEASLRLEVGSVIIESIQELELLERLAAAANKKLEVSVRLNPENRINSTGRVLKQTASQFGMDEELGADLAAALKHCKYVSVIGTHSHIQSQILDAKSAVQNLGHSLNAASNFSAAAGFSLKHVNLGGGLGIPYSKDQEPVDFAVFAAGLKDLITTARRRTEFAQTRFSLEFGRYIVGEAGTFVTRVLYTKVSRGKKFVITDGGFTQSQIACGVGQIVRRTLPIEAYLNTNSTQTETVTIAGPSCYGLDILAQDQTLPVLQQGDLIGIRNVGAYGYSFSPTKFLRQRDAEEFFV